MPMLLPMPLSQFVNSEIQYMSLSVKRMQQDATGLGLSVANCSQAMERGISRDGCVSTRTLGSYIVRMLGVVRSFLRLVKSLSCVGVQSQAFFALNSSRNGLDNSAMFGENLPSWFTIPRNLQSSETDFGVSICCTAAVLLGSAVMPL